MFCVLCVCIACSKSEDNAPIEPTPQEKVIETTETGSLKLIMLGYDNNITEGGVLQPKDFANPIYIKDKKICGTSYTFALCSGVKRLDAVPESSSITEWKEQGDISEGAVFWVCQTTDTKYSYLKLRIAYIEENKVGVEYKISSVKERPDIDDIILTEQGAKPFIFKGFLNATEDGLFPEGIASKIVVDNKNFKGLNYSFVEYANVQQLSGLPEVSTVTTWKETAKIAENTSYWLRYLTQQEYVYIKLRVAYIDADNVGVEYKISSRGELVNINANAPILGKPYVTDYSIPHLNPQNYYVEHAVTFNSQIVFNYALEWNKAKKHSAWVAFSFDNITKGDNVGRTDAWEVDPQLPEDMRVDNDSHRSDGFDRGHICASEDRVYSREANMQTFYYSNMSPQLNSFNGGFWAAFEKRVREWGRYSYNKLYVTKGGTINQLLVNYTGEKKGPDGVIPKTDANGLTIHGLACPKFYYMAILSEKNGVFHAIGFWVEHRDDYGYQYGDNVPASVLKTHIVSIDDLEQKTGLDFFCNLPDDLENTVEKVCNEADWVW